MTVVVLYGRPGCHLCEEARERLAALAAARDGVLLREVDIEADDELFRAYLERIPVVTVGGELVSELLLDEDAVLRRLDTVEA